MRLACVVWLAACGHVDFAPQTCDDPNQHGTPLALGDTIAGNLCPGDTDRFAVQLAAGDELQVDLVVDGPGWPTLAIDDANGGVRALSTYESTNAGFAPADGTYYVVVAGVA